MSNADKSKIHGNDAKGFFAVLMIVCSIVGLILAVAISVLGALITAGWLPALLVVVGWLFVISTFSLWVIGDGSVKNGIIECLKA